MVNMSVKVVFVLFTSFSAYSIETSILSPRHRALAAPPISDFVVNVESTVVLDVYPTLYDTKRKIIAKPKNRTNVFYKKFSYFGMEIIKPKTYGDA